MKKLFQKFIGKYKHLDAIKNYEHLSPVVKSIDQVLFVSEI